MNPSITNRWSRRTVLLTGAALAGAACQTSAPALSDNFAAHRLFGGPIITPGMDARMGANIEGPSLIRAPEWLPGRLGNYYLYFADHKGDYIRLAHADRLSGPWKVHAPGSLQLAQSGFPTTPPPGPGKEVEAEMAQRWAGDAPPEAKGIPTALENANAPHIASPDVHVEHAQRRIVMYYHGLESFGVQRSRVATSSDGINFQTVGGLIAPSYLRAVRYGGYVYAITMPGLFLRSRDGLSGFERGPNLFEQNQRHTALLLRGDTLHVFWTRVGDAPERIYVSTIDMRPDWMAWKASEPREILRPQHDWEGANLPVERSYRSAINLPVNQLRDPCIFEENGRVYLLYAVKGEGGIAIAELRG